MDDRPLMAKDLHEELQALDRILRETRRHAHNRQAQHLAISAVSHLAEVKFPTGFGENVDKALLQPVAEAIFLHCTLRRAQRNLPTLPEDIDAVIDGINRFLEVLRQARANLLSIGKE
jgi:hypothetical protein